MAQTVSLRLSAQHGADLGEGAYPGGGDLLLNLGFGRGFVGLPVFAGQVLGSVNRTVGSGEQGVGLHGHVGGEFAGPLRLAFEADRDPCSSSPPSPARAAAARASPTVVEQKRPAPTAEPTSAPTMRWKCISVALPLRELSKASAIRLRALACSARIAS
jgi:hypothetical protein